MNELYFTFETVRETLLRQLLVTYIRVTSRAESNSHIIFVENRQMDNLSAHKTMSQNPNPVKVKLYTYQVILTIFVCKFIHFPTEVSRNKCKKTTKFLF